MRKLRLAVVIAVASVSCEAGNDEIVPTRFARSFASAQCWTGPSAVAPAPCSTYSAASHRRYVDSMRVTFAADGTVQWMLGTHLYMCPCYLGGCTNPCEHQAPVVTQVSGTYTIDADTVALVFSQAVDPQASDGLSSVKLQGVIPDRVTADWAGPDSLVYFRNPNFVIIRSP